MNSLYQMSKFSRIFFSSVYMTKTFVWIVKILVNCLKLSNHMKCKNFGNACNFQYFSKLSKNVKMVNNCRKLYWLLKMVQIVNNVEYYLNWLNCQKSFKLSKLSNIVPNVHNSQKIFQTLDNCQKLSILLKFLKIDKIFNQMSKIVKIVSKFTNLSTVKRESVLMPVVLFETYILHGWSPLFSWDCWWMVVFVVFTMCRLKKYISMAFPSCWLNFPVGSTSLWLNFPVGSTSSGSSSIWLNFPLAPVPTGSTSLWLQFPLAQLPSGSSSLWLNFPLAPVPSGSTSLWLNFPLAQVLFGSTSSGTSSLGHPSLSGK